MLPGKNPLRNGLLFPGGDLKDLNLNLDTGGLHKGTLNISLIACDRCENIIAQVDHLVALSINPDACGIFQSTGVQRECAK